MVFSACKCSSLRSNPSCRTPNPERRHQPCDAKPSYTFHMFDQQRALTKWVDVKVTCPRFPYKQYLWFVLLFSLLTLEVQVTGASSISCGGSTIACGCNEGIVRLFETETLMYKATLPRPLADDLAYAINISTAYLFFHADMRRYIEASNKKHPDVKSVVRFRKQINLNAHHSRLLLFCIRHCPAMATDCAVYIQTGECIMLQQFFCSNLFCRSIVVFNISNTKSISRVYSSMCATCSTSP